ncbi:MAG: hypothetical protein KA004_13980 [Verrucomicrobiales bacterium]|nr:hypothetical protein [Verrucomicrobiales bacterium]
MDANAAEFLAAAGQFQLGALDTERPHPLTTRLSELAQHRLPEAIETLKAVDIQALECFSAKAPTLLPLAESIGRALEAGRRIFLCGCGATGRLSVSLEVFCREGLVPSNVRDQVVSVMAGGEVGLIRTVPDFEDRPDRGARQLEEAGFHDGDLLLASTEGGETPWVIGAVERAAELSAAAPWFLYCNPDSVLTAVAGRSRRVLADSRIRKLSLAVGPMAICGSTRMQAATVLLAAIGIALQHHHQPENVLAAPQALHSLVAGTEFGFLTPFIEREAASYQTNRHVLYCPGQYGMTVLTDTVERCPTFALRPFENQINPAEPASWCHLWMQGTSDSGAAWRQLLHRAPRTLEWEDLQGAASASFLQGFDFSDALPEKRRQRTEEAPHLIFSIGDSGDELEFRLGPQQHRVPIASASVLFRHLLLKLLLNTHSTLVMGRMGRFADNLMTHLRPANFKLIDRAIRYVRLLAERRTGEAPPYEAVARQLFDDLLSLAPDESIVLKTLASFLPPPPTP